MNVPPELAAFMKECRLNLQDYLPHDLLIPGLATVSGYAVEDSGKQVRPVLACAAALTIQPDPVNFARAAAALELIHTYSLIHDDLPAMDNDDMRRGKPSLHKAYDEASAILVGDGLQARAFELIADAPDLSSEQKVGMIKVLAHSAGMEGMVGGQYIDIRAVDSDMTLEELQAMHLMKTGALIRAALVLGGIAAHATESQLAHLDEFGRNIGLAFQVVDDVLDVEGDPALLGKTSGKDADANKPTYVKLLGVDEAKEEARRLHDAAIEALAPFGDAADLLRSLARYIVERNH